MRRILILIDASLAPRLSRRNLECHNANPTPFMWTKSAEAILDKEARAFAKLRTIKGGDQALESEH